MFVAAIAACLLALPDPPTDVPTDAAKAAPQVGHMVYFKLKDATAASRDKLVASCEARLAGLDGVVYFSAGARGEEFKREVNDVDFDVALHVVFTDKAAYDAYEVHPEHVKFIDENKANWAKVRVFDSNVKARAKGKAARR